MGMSEKVSCGEGGGWEENATPYNQNEETGGSLEERELLGVRGKEGKGATQAKDLTCW